MTMVFASFGVALLLRHMVLLIFGPNPIYYSNELQFAVLLPGNVRVLPDQVFLLGLTIVVVFGLHLFMTRSRTGIAMRGVSENPDLSRVAAEFILGVSFPADGNNAFFGQVDDDFIGDASLIRSFFGSRNGHLHFLFLLGDLVGDEEEN